MRQWDWRWFRPLWRVRMATFPWGRWLCTGVRCSPPGTTSVRYGTTRLPTPRLLALSDASVALDSWRLPEVTLVVTLEPCPCAQALWSPPVWDDWFSEPPIPSLEHAARSTTSVPIPD